jgi:molybdopterin-guanine dinucleotide biosynthesis protein A
MMWSAGSTATGVRGVVLAGGQSRRLGGSPKALLLFGGRPLIQHIVERVETVLPGCLVVTNTPDLYAFLGRPLIPDVYPGGGSLGGLYSGLRAAGSEAALCVGCDMPFLSPALLRYLAERHQEADVVVPEAGGELQTLHAVYGRGCLRAMERRLREGQLRITGFFPDVRVRRVPAEEVARLADPARAFFNVNTPDDLARARAAWEDEPGSAG